MLMVSFWLTLWPFVLDAANLLKENGGLSSIGENHLR